MKAPHMILATALIALAFNVASAADNNKNTKTKTEKPVAAQQAATVSSYEQKIVEMQKAIEQLRIDIEHIKAARNELQVKLEQSDKDIAAQTMKVEDIKKKLADKQRAVEALAKEKKR